MVVMNDAGCLSTLGGEELELCSLRPHRVCVEGFLCVGLCSVCWGNTVSASERLLHRKEGNYSKLCYKG